jgi:hypothetical protein
MAIVPVCSSVTWLTMKYVVRFFKPFTLPFVCDMTCYEYSSHCSFAGLQDFDATILLW